MRRDVKSNRLLKSLVILALIFGILLIVVLILQVLILKKQASQVRIYNYTEEELQEVRRELAPRNLPTKLDFQ